MDRIKKLKIKKQDGTFSDYIPIGADAENIDTADGESVEIKLNKKPYYYDNVADMKADNKLKIGDMAITLGYYEANDGGGAEYRIKETSNSYYESLNNELVAELIIKNNEINILQVGGKNDESTDIGVLINTLTSKYDIFLPCGKYKVTTNISLINSLRGTGYPRSGNSAESNYAWLIDNVNSGAVILISNSNNANEINVSNLGIFCNNCNYGILYDPKAGYSYIHHIMIKNVSNRGIACKHTTKNISRGCYVDTVCIFGKAFTSSYGIDNDSADNYFTNLEIMGARIGIVSSADLRLSDAHIWCGSMTGHDQDNWWNGTRGLMCYSDAIINNLYLDTCFCPIAVLPHNNTTYTNHTVLINNFKYWMDKSVEESEHYDGTLALSWPANDDNPNYWDNIVINNGYIYTGGRISNIGSGRYNNMTFLLPDFTQINDYYRLIGESPVKYSMRYSNLAVNKYNLIGIIQYKDETGTNGGFLKFTFNTFNGHNGEFVVYRKYNQLEVVLTPINYYGDGTEHLYYKKENGFIYVYALSTTLNEQYSITIDNNGQTSRMGALDLSRIRIRNDNGTYSFIKEVLDSASGLTEITRGLRLDPVEGSI